MLRSAAVFTLALAASACASTSGGGTGEAPPQAAASGPAAIYQNAAGDIQVNLGADNSAVATNLGLSADQAFTALGAVYGDLGIALTAHDPATRTLGNERFIFTRRLGGKPGSEWLRCGYSPTGLPVADTYRVQVYIRSNIEPQAGGTSRVVTLVQAFARSTEGTSNTPVRCLSTGMLEREIANRVMLKAATG